MSSLKPQYSASELAAMKLPCLPRTRDNIRLLAEREGWKVHKRKGRGGVRHEYEPPTIVREAIQAKLATQLTHIATASTDYNPAAVTGLHISHTQSLCADARLGVLQVLQSLMQRTGYPMKKAAALLLDMARLGTASEQLQAMLKLARNERGRPSPDGLPSVRSLLRLAEYQQQGRLAPAQRQPQLTVPPWAASFMRHYQRPEKPTLEHAYRQFAVQWQAEQGQAELPSVWQVRRFVSKVGEISRHSGRMGERELKTLKPFIRRSFADLLPGDIYSADGHTFDAEVQHPLHGRPFRPEITTLVDIATRKAVGWSVGLAESALVVLDALRDACLKHGIPAVFYVDNGSGYKNQMMLDSATGFMARLGIEMINSLPYNSQARGVIERLHHSIWVKAAKTLPGYVGRDMDKQARQSSFKITRQAIRQSGTSGSAAAMPLLGWGDFVQFCEQQVADYNARPHRSLPRMADPATGRRRHMSPDEQWATHVAQGFVPHSISDDEARPLFRPQLLRTVRRCEIELLGQRYFARALEEHHSEQLHVGYDIHDPSRVWVYDAAGHFLCHAELDGNQRDYLPRSLLQQARDKRAQGRERRLQNQLQEVRAERHGQPALTLQADEVLPGLRGQDIAGAFERLHSSPASTPTAKADEFAVPADPQQRLQLHRQLTASATPLSPQQQRWLASYAKSHEYKVLHQKTA